MVRLLDVNVLVYAYRTDAPDHPRVHAWLTKVVNGDEAFGAPALALAGFLRVVTHPKVFSPPSPLDDALRFVETLRSLPNYVEVAPGVRHFGIFIELCRRSNAKGNLIPDAYLAALALESGCEWVSCDRGFARFPGLRCVHPFDAG